MATIAADLRGTGPRILILGGGFELALSADLIIATDTASFTLPENQRRHAGRCRHHQAAQAHSYHVAMDML